MPFEKISGNNIEFEKYSCTSPNTTYMRLYMNTIFFRSTFKLFILNEKEKKSAHIVQLNNVHCLYRT